MRRQLTAILVFLSSAAIIACAQTPAPLPEVSTFVRQAILQQRIAESREREYVFREDVGENKLTKICTWSSGCPGGAFSIGPRASAHYLLASGGSHFEIFWLDGSRVARVLPDSDWVGMTNATVNLLISDDELAAENQRLDREVAEVEALRAQGAGTGSSDDPPQILLSKLLELCSFSHPRRQMIDGRSTILLDFSWDPSARALDANEALLKFFSGTVAIDEEDRAVEHVAGGFTTDVNLAEGRIRIRKGTRVRLTNTRVDQGLWLLSDVDAWGKARYFSFSFNGEGRILAGDYRKFHGPGQMLPGFERVATDTPAASPAKP